MFITEEAVLFDVAFRDWPKEDGSPGDLVDPTIVKWTLYTSTWKKLDERTMGPTNRISVGKYKTFHVFDSEGVYISEWWGEVDGLPAVERKQITVKKIRQ